MDNFEYILRHHGVEGQRWGVRNGPPYPLETTKRTKNTFKTKKK